MRLARHIFLLCLMFLFEVGGCVTAGDVVQKKFEDPTGVQTISESPDSSEDHASIEEYKRQIAILQGQLEESQHLSKQEIEALKKKLQELESKNVAPPPPVPSQAEAGKGDKGADLLWKSIVDLVAQKKYKDALTQVEDLIKTYPKFRKYYISLIAKGMLLYNLESYSEAVLIFNKVIDEYPKNNSTVIAWYGAGLSLLKLKKESDAKLFFEEVTKAYPQSPQAKRAKLHLDKKAKIESDFFEAFPSWWNSAIK